MVLQRQLGLIREKLLNYDALIETETLLPTVVPEAAPLVANDPYAFMVAACLDRGTKAEIIWTIPFYLKSELGHLDPRRIYKMSLEDLAKLFARLPQRPRYVNDSPKTLSDLTRIVVEEYQGDASKIWTGKRAPEISRTLLSIHGVGIGIANMTVLLIEKNFHLHFNDFDHTKMDIKPDVHTVRVLYRLGVSEAMDTEAATQAARRLNPDFPGAVDASLWTIGRRFCFSSKPNCMGCPVNEVCEKQISQSIIQRMEPITQSHSVKQTLTKDNAAGLAQLTSKQAVLKAADECKVIGEENFLIKYGFRAPREVFLKLDNTLYPAKAIVGVAYKYQFPGKGPLTWSDFSSGEPVIKKLRQLGFTSDEIVDLRPVRKKKF